MSFLKLNKNELIQQFRIEEETKSCLSQRFWVKVHITFLYFMKKNFL